MPKKLQLLPNYFLNMDHIVSWEVREDGLTINTINESIRVGHDAFIDDVQITYGDLQLLMSQIDSYFN